MSLPGWHEEPILKRHDRRSFDCGDSSMNEFLQRYAREREPCIGCRENLRRHRRRRQQDHSRLLQRGAGCSGLCRYAGDGSSRPCPARRAGLSAGTHCCRPPLAGPLTRRATLRRRRAALLARSGRSRGRRAHHRCKGRPRSPLVRHLRRCAFSRQTSNTRHATGYVRRRIESGRAFMTAASGLLICRPHRRKRTVHQPLPVCNVRA